MSLIYSTYVATMANLMVTSSTNTQFVQILPSIIDYAEQRIYRETDLLNTVVRDSSANVTANNRNFTLPSASGRFVVTNGINVISPVGFTVANGTRNQLQPVSRDYIDGTWTSNTAASATTVPECYAMIDDQTIIFGPPPGASFNVEVVGTIRPTPLSSSNTSTYLTNYLPDLFVAASMVFASGYQRNFGAQSDDARSAASWEDQYQKLFQSENMEEVRKKYMSVGWTSLSPSPTATPPRQ